ncbi:hypothetical protein JW930_05040 [Candidatus Woesearchaeota archaeon]|nr:hypothetical protein [Candidatus Woesearchaeota archaeon]
MVAANKLEENTRLEDILWLLEHAVDTVRLDAAVRHVDEKYPDIAYEYGPRVFGGVADIRDITAAGSEASQVNEDPLYAFEVARAKANIAAKMAELSGKKALFFDYSTLRDFLAELEEIRQELRNQTIKVGDRNIEIFLIDESCNGSCGQYRMNPELIEALRKEPKSISNKDWHVYMAVRHYYDILNVLDTFKNKSVNLNWANEHNDALISLFDYIEKRQKRLESGAFPEDAAELILRHDARHKGYMTREWFNEEALRYDKQAILFLDLSGFNLFNRRNMEIASEELLQVLGDDEITPETAARADKILYGLLHEVDDYIYKCSQVILDVLTEEGYEVPIITRTGDEILIALPGTDAGKTARIAAHIRDKVTELSLYGMPQRMRVGFTDLEYQEGSNEEARIRELSAALKRANVASDSGKRIEKIDGSTIIYTPFGEKIEEWREILHRGESEGESGHLVLSSDYQVLDSQPEIQATLGNVDLYLPNAAELRIGDESYIGEQRKLVNDYGRLLRALETDALGDEDERNLQEAILQIAKTLPVVLPDKPGRSVARLAIAGNGHGMSHLDGTGGYRELVGLRSANQFLGYEGTNQLLGETMRVQRSAIGDCFGKDAVVVEQWRGRTTCIFNHSQGDLIRIRQALGWYR